MLRLAQNCVVQCLLVAVDQHQLRRQIDLREYVKPAKTQPAHPGIAVLDRPLTPLA